MPKAVPLKVAKQAADPKADRAHKDFEPSEQEQTAVKDWLDRVRRAEDNPARKAWKEGLDNQRAYVYGTKHKDGDQSTLTRTNLVFATIAAMMPHLYAKNPDIGVTPTAGCPEGQLQQMKKFGRTAEAVLSQMLVKEGKLKRRAKSNVRSTMTTAFGTLKLLFQSNLAGDPIILRRIQDTQDNIARVEALAADLKKGDDVKQIALQRDELKAQLQGLMSGNEVKIFKGFTIDRLASEDFLILDESIIEFDEYVDARALGHFVWMTVGAFKSKFKADPHGATRYNQPNPKDGAQQTGTPDGQSADDMFVCVVEIWDKDAQVVRTVAKGMNRWCREPYAPKNTPQRWYPFYALGFNLVEGRWRPISDVELLMKLQDEYNTTRTNFADVRADAVPIRVFRKGGNLTEEDIKALSVLKRNRDFIGIEGSPTVPLSQDIMQLEGPKIDPQAYDVSLIRNDMDVVVGMSDAGRANLIKPKTATEAEIMQQALGLRVEERRDTNEDMISDMAEAALEICLRTLSLEEVKQIAGADAEWPQMDVQEIFTLVDVTVRAGSSGKPNQAKEREQWTQLLPVISSAMEQVGKLREQGNFDMADAVVDLLRETLRRFQERLDVDALIPPIKKGADGQPVVQAQMMLEARQMAEKLTAQVEELRGALEACQADLAKAKEQEAAKVAAENAKAVKAQEDAQVAQAKIASDERTTLDEQARKESVAKYEADRKAEIEREKLAAEDAKHGRDLAHQVDVKKIQVGATEEERAEKEQGKADAQQMATSMQALEQMLNGIIETGKKLEERIEGLQALAKAPRSRRIEVDPQTGLPSRLVDEVAH